MLCIFKAYMKLNYVILFYIMLFYFKLCYVYLRPILLYNVRLYYVILYDVILYDVMLYEAISCVCSRLGVLCRRFSGCRMRTRVCSSIWRSVRVTAGSWRPRAGHKQRSEGHRGG